MLIGCFYSVIDIKRALKIIYDFKCYNYLRAILYKSAIYDVREAIFFICISRSLSSIGIFFLLNFIVDISQSRLF